MVCCQGTTGHAFLKGRFFIYQDVYKRQVKKAELSIYGETGDFAGKNYPIYQGQCCMIGKMCIRDRRYGYTGLPCRDAVRI